MLIFLESEAALQEFTKRKYEFGEVATTVAITVAASAKAGTDGASAGAQTDSDSARSVGVYNIGMAKAAATAK
jgi:hypothetical protein